eukprot:334972-Pelagomonas_calceolata.AAC.1
MNQTQRAASVWVRNLQQAHSPLSAKYPQAVLVRSSRSDDQGKPALHTPMCPAGMQNQATSAQKRVSTSPCAGASPPSPAHPSYS